MKRFISSILFIALFSIFTLSCTRTVYVPIEREVDTTVDTRDTLINAKIPFECATTETMSSFASAETSFAIATAQTNNGVLTLNLQNKDVNVPVLSKVHYSITTVKEPVPYPVEVVKKEKYVAWYDYLIRIVGIPSFILVVIYVVRRWKRGLRPLVGF